jgi:hypothetical protein
VADDAKPNLDQRCTSKTRKGKRCRNRPLPGLKKCAVHSSSAKAKSSAAKGQVAPAHRPDTITEERIVHMETLLHSGSYISVACQVAGIPYSTHKDWMKRGQLAGGKNGQYRAYADRIEVALAIGEDNLVKSVAAGAVEDWRAAAWMLERKEPERWGKKSIAANAEDSAKAKPAGESETPLADILKEMRAGGKPAGQG